MMDSEFVRLATRFTRGYGIADCPVTVLSERIGQPFLGQAAPLQCVGRTSDFSAVIQFLSVLSWPASRHVAFAAGSQTTALINNSRNGSDYANQTVWLARYLNCRFARILDQDDEIWENGTDRITMRYAATIFELCSAAGELIRSVCCINDGGRWKLSEAGLRLAVENSFPWSARRIRDRFTTAELVRLADACGISVIEPENFLNAGNYLLMESPHPPANSCSLADADDPAYLFFLRGMSWVPRMETHASSIIADLERCLALNPAWESRVRDVLERARRVSS